MTMFRLSVLLTGLACVALTAEWRIGVSTAARSHDAAVPSRLYESPRTSELVPSPLGVPWPVFPKGEPPDRDQVAAGEALFFDTSLSADGRTSCATCLRPDAGFADPRPVSRGTGGKEGRRNSQTLLNAALFTQVGWSGAHPTLEAHTLAALTNPHEMGLQPEHVIDRLSARARAHVSRLGDGVSTESVVRALAAFQRTLIRGTSPFDRYIYGGDAHAVGAAAKRGFRLFLGRGRCVQCHFMRSEASHPFGGSTGLYADDRFHNIGVGYDEAGNITDLGRFEVTGRDEDRGAFRTPTLRDVALTAPYMHDGSLATLSDVIEHYDKGGRPNPFLDPDIRSLHLSAQNKRDLVTFLESLTSASR
jgi:cytochrome c peroxidase